MFTFLILIGDRKDIKFPDSVRKSQGQKAKSKLMNARTQNQAFAHNFPTDKTIELPVLSNILIISS
ncbi:hypothetical protein GBN68_15390 [Acinetobacter johnsonii]|nr:hypothetical protein GBN68_15390 [Acinetobacter johnsonii]